MSEDYAKDLHQQTIQVVQHHRQEHNIQEIQIAQSQQITSTMLGQEMQELLLDLSTQLELEQQHYQLEIMLEPMVQFRLQIIQMLQNQ